METAWSTTQHGSLQHQCHQCLLRRGPSQAVTSMGRKNILTVQQKDMKDCRMDVAALISFSSHDLFPHVSTEQAGPSGPDKVPHSGADNAERASCMQITEKHPRFWAPEIPVVESRNQSKHCQFTNDIGMQKLTLYIIGEHVFQVCHLCKIYQQLQIYHYYNQSINQSIYNIHISY